MTRPLHVYVAMPGNAHASLQSSVGHRHRTESLTAMGHSVSLGPVELDPLFPLALAAGKVPGWEQRRANADRAIVSEVERVHAQTPIDAFFGYLYEWVSQIRYFLEHDAEREAIRAAGHARACAEHTWAHRFEQLFTKIGMRSVG